MPAFPRRNICGPFIPAGPSEVLGLRIAGRTQTNSGSSLDAGSKPPHPVPSSSLNNTRPSWPFPGSRFRSAERSQHPRAAKKITSSATSSGQPKGASGRGFPVRPGHPLGGGVTTSPFRSSLRAADGLSIHRRTRLSRRPLGGSEGRSAGPPRNMRAGPGSRRRAAVRSVRRCGHGGSADEVPAEVWRKALLACRGRHRFRGEFPRFGDPVPGASFPVIGPGHRPTSVQVFGQVEFPVQQGAPEMGRSTSGTPRSEQFSTRPDVPAASG